MGDSKAAADINYVREQVFESPLYFGRRREQLRASCCLMMPFEHYLLHFTFVLQSVEPGRYSALVVAPRAAGSETWRRRTGCGGS